MLPSRCGNCNHKIAIVVTKKYNTLTSTACAMNCHAESKTPKKPPTIGNKAIEIYVYCCQSYSFLCVVSLSDLDLKEKEKAKQNNTVLKEQVWDVVPWEGKSLNCSHKLAGFSSFNVLICNIRSVCTLLPGFCLHGQYPVIAECWTKYSQQKTWPCR